MTQGNALAASFELAPVLPLSEAERWYVARTLPQRELHAARQLANQGFRTFVSAPLEEPTPREEG